jgi:hypothetical protein
MSPDCILLKGCKRGDTVYRIEILEQHGSHFQT